MKGSLLVILILVFSAIVIVPGVAPYAFAQASSSAVKNVEGEVVMVDVQNSTVTVRQTTDKDSYLAENVTLTVNKATTMNKGGMPLVFSDLQMGVKIAATYKSTLDGENIAESISIK